MHSNTHAYDRADAPRVAYTIPLNPFMQTRNSPRAPLMNGAVPAIHVLPLHLAALDAVPSRLAAILLLLPRDRYRAVVPGYKAMLERQQQVRRRVAVELLRVANNSLGSYGMYLHAFHATRERFDFYIFCEDDYLPSRSHFDTALVRLYRRAFPSSPVTSPTATAEAATAGAATAEGVLAGVLQGRPIEPKNRWRLHLETSHIMSARALDVLSRRTYAEGRAFRGSLTDRMLVLAAEQRIGDSYKFGAIQGAFGLLLADAGLYPFASGLAASTARTGTTRTGSSIGRARRPTLACRLAARFSCPCSGSSPHVISSCLPAGPPPRSGWKEGIDACRLPMHAGTLLRRDGPMCGCDVAATAYRHLVELRAPYVVRDVEDGADAAGGGGQAAGEREKRQRTRTHRVGMFGHTRDHAVNLTDVLADAIMTANLSRGPRRTGTRQRMGQPPHHGPFITGPTGASRPPPTNSNACIRMHTAWGAPPHLVPARRAAAVAADAAEGTSLMSFCVLRNPAERFASAFRDFVDDKRDFFATAASNDSHGSAGGGGAPLRLGPQKCTAEGFNRYVRHAMLYLEGGRRHTEWCHLTPQADYVVGAGSRRWCEYMLRYEHLESELALLLREQHARRDPPSAAPSPSVSVQPQHEPPHEPPHQQPHQHSRHLVLVKTQLGTV